MEPTTKETASHPETLKQLQFLGFNDNGDVVFRRGIKSTESPPSTDVEKEEKGNGQELSQSEIDKQMMPPPPTPLTSLRSSTVAGVHDQPPSEPTKKRRCLSNELSEDFKDHDPDCLFMEWVTHRKTLMSDDEVRSAFIENASMKKVKKKRDLALTKIPEALEQDGHVMQYLKSQREYYDTFKQQFIDECECYEEYSGSTN